VAYASIQGMTTVRWEEFAAERPELSGLGPSRKGDGADPDGRYPLQPVPARHNEDAFYLSGRAEHLVDRAAGG
jgi:hypothetical protein